MLLLKGVLRGVEALTCDEMRNLLRERELRYRAEEAVGLVLDLDDAFSDKKLELKCASMPTPKLRVFFNRKVRALRSFLEANKDLQDITEDSRYEELI